MNEILSLLVRANLVAAAAIGLILVLRPFMTRRFGPEVTYRLWALAPLASPRTLIWVRWAISTRKRMTPSAMRCSGTWTAAT